MTIQGMEFFACKFEIEVDGRIHAQTVEAPRFILERQSIGYVSQATRTNPLARVKMSGVVPIYDNFDGKWIERDDSVAFTNLAYERETNNV